MLNYTIKDIVKFCTKYKDDCIKCPICFGYDVDDYFFKEPSRTTFNYSGDSYMLSPNLNVVF